MGILDLQQFGSPELLAAAAARDCLHLLHQGGPGAASFHLALSGGRIAKSFCSSLAKLAVNASELGMTHFFWSDERCVPPSDPESNFRLAHDSLLGPLSMPDGRVHRIQGELDPNEACARASSDLRGLAPAGADGQPVLNLVLLGMGEDGHIASLFPSEPEKLTTDPAIFRPVSATKPPPLRITMGYQTIRAAREVWVLASGDGKAQALRDSLRGGRTPLARLLAIRPALRIYTDIAGAISRT